MKRFERSLWAVFFILLEMASLVYATVDRIEEANFEHRDPLSVFSEQLNALDDALSQRTQQDVSDLLNMDHPQFTAEHWLDTFHLHVQEIHKRGHRLTLRQSSVDASFISQAFQAIAAKLDLTGAVANMSQVPPPAAVNYTQVPVNPKLILEGVITGMVAVFVPAESNVTNGTEALSTFQQCFDPRKLEEQFAVKDFFSAQAALPNITDDDLANFQASVESMMGTDWSPEGLLQAFNSFELRTVQLWQYLSAILRKLSPYLLNVLKHAYRCGVIDLILGFALAYILPFFPPLLIILIAVAAMAFEIFADVKMMIDNWYQDWFEFGFAFGKILAFAATLIIAYKLGNGDSVTCPAGQGSGCSYEMPQNEMNDWQPPGSTKVCGGELCNPVFQRNDIIDPYRLDSMGRTNIERMKQGIAAIGPDGKSINLHHIYQTPDGPIAELTETFHTVNHKALHTFLEPGEPSRIDRAAFDIWRSAYWRQRGTQMETDIASGVYGATFGTSAPSWPIIGSVALTKAWNDTAAEAPAVGDWLGMVLDNITDGDPTSLVTSVRAELGSLDVVRLLIKAMRGFAVDAANADDAAIAAVYGTTPAPTTAPVGGATPFDQLVACATNENCSDVMVLAGELFNRVDGQVENLITKTHLVHFEPDSGFALSLSSFISEGQAMITVASADATMAVDLAEVDGIRVTQQLTTAGELLAEYANATHRFTLQDCDGYGDYQVQINGQRPPPDPSTYESDDGNATIRAYWAENGLPPDPTASIYGFGAQYVPYPNITGQVSATIEGAFQFAASDIGSLYHVFLAPLEAPAAATVCDVLRVGQLALTTVDNATDMVIAQITQPPQPMVAYVVAESDGGAMAIYPTDAPMSNGNPYGSYVAGAPLVNVGAAVGVSLAVLVVLVAIVAVVLFALWKKGVIFKRVTNA